MPKYLDRATRTLVTQYGNEDSRVLRPIPEVINTARRACAPKAFNALERLLDACSEAEKNTPRGRTPMVTAHWIRKQITEALDVDA